MAVMYLATRMIPAQTCVHGHRMTLRGVVWLSYVAVFIVQSESKRLPRTNFMAEDIRSKENIQVIFVYTALNFESNQIVEKG